MQDQTTYTLTEVGKLLGESPQKMHHWITRGLIVDTGKRCGRAGWCRAFTFWDVVAIVTIRQLKKQGVQLKALRKLASFIQSGAALENLAEYPYIVACGRRVWAARPGAVFLAGRNADAIVVDLRAGVERVRKLLDQGGQNERADCSDGEGTDGALASATQAGA